MDAAYGLEGGMRQGVPRAWNSGGRQAVWLSFAGWRAARVGAVRASARMFQGAEITTVGTSWLARRGAYDFARGYNAISGRTGNRLGNIAYGTGPAPYRPRPGNAGAPLEVGMPLPGAMGPLPPLHLGVVWSNRWPERRWAAAGLRLANAA